MCSEVRSKTGVGDGLTCVSPETAGDPSLQEPDDVWRLQRGLHAGGGPKHRQGQTYREASVCNGRLQSEQ